MANCDAMSGYRNWSYEFFGNNLWMNCMSTSFNDCIEPIMIVGCVMDGTNSTIRFSQRIRALHNIANAFFDLFFSVACMRIFNPVFKIVFWWCLELMNKNNGAWKKLMDFLRNSRRLARDGWLWGRWWHGRWKFLLSRLIHHLIRLLVHHPALIHHLGGRLNRYYPRNRTQRQLLLNKPTQQRRKSDENMKTITIFLKI